MRVLKYRNVSFDEHSMREQVVLKNNNFRFGYEKGKNSVRNTDRLESEVINLVGKWLGVQ